MNRTRSMTYTALGTATIAVCAQLTIPFDVPVTLQTLGVFLAVTLLGTVRGTAAVFLYIVMGAVGLPVFSSFRGGLGVLSGITGGYIIGFLPAAITAGLIIGKNSGRPRSFIALVIGNIALYAFGTAWFTLLWAKSGEAIGVLTVLTKCVFPFIPGDIAKIYICVVITSLLKGKIIKDEKLQICP